MKDRIKLLMEEYPELFPTEAKFWSWLRGCLRRGIWEKSPMKLKFKNESCEPPPEGYTGRAKSGKHCALSGVWEGKSKLEVDHIDGNKSLTKEEDIIPFIEHLLATKNELQLVTKEAHKTKSYSERMGISYEEAVIEKQVIAFGKLKANEQLTKMRELGINTKPTKKAREDEYRRYLQDEVPNV